MTDHASPQQRETPVQRVRWLGLAVRVAVSTLLASWLFRVIDVSTALRLLKDVGWPFMSLAILSVATAHAMNCHRWRWCLLEDSQRVSFRTIAISYWTSLFVGTALPGEYGGDVLRVRDVWSRLGSGSTAMASVVWSRLSGIWATFFVFTLVGLVRFDRLTELSMVGVWGVCLILCAAMLTVGLSPRLLETAMHLVARCPWSQRIRTSLLRVHSTGQALATHPFYSWRIAASALLTQALMIATNSLYAWALDQPVKAIDMALVVPLVTLSSVLPVSLGGIGVKEGAFVILLSSLGLSHEGALSIALLNRLILLGLALIGGVLFPFRRRLLVDLQSPGTTYGRSSPLVTEENEQ